ncbi:hypothetical protein D3C76_1247450 [compost metagenome]
MQLLKGEHFDRKRLKLLNEIRMGLPLFPRGGEPFTRIALLFVVDIVGRIERHTAVEMSDMFFYPLLAFIAIPLFITGQIVALPNVIHQLLHQY